jgi:hypothetical protein
MVRKPVKKKTGKKIGRPATGRDPLIGVRFAPEARRKVEVWAKRHDLNFSEAVRRLIALGLEHRDDDPKPLRPEALRRIAQALSRKQLPLGRHIAMTKSKHERSVFLDFAKAAGIPIDVSSVESPNPPEPDIRVSVGGETVYYELGRILDDYMQGRRKTALKNAPKQASVNPSRAGLPEHDVLQSKLSNSYSTNGLPLEILLYYDSETPWVLGGIPPVDFKVFASHVMEPLLMPMPSHIRRVWVFERYCNSILWCHPG